MTVGILARRVQFMHVPGVLNRTDPDAAAAELLDQIDDERRLAVILPPDDVDTIHAWIRVSRFACLTQCREAAESNASHSKASDSPAGST